MEDRNLPIALEGQIMNITYSNEETGYTVARLSIDDERDPVIIVGNIMSPVPGEVLSVKGTWVNHPRFGRQFKVEGYNVKAPITIKGIKKYLGSGLIKGIGPVMASRIVKQFGKKTLEIIENRTEELARIDGIGPKRVEMIKKAWSDQKDIRDVMIFLQAHGVGSGYATKIFKQYGSGSISVVRKNPYRLAVDISGIGFSTADRIAENLDFKKNAPVRVEAGILYVMDQLADEGNVYFPYEQLIEKCREVLEVERDIIIQAFGPLVREKRIVFEDINRDLEKFKPDNKAIYLTRFYVSEKGIADSLSRLNAHEKKLRKVDEEKAVKWVQERTGLNLAENQIRAIKSAISDKVMVITGGPGTGKTTIIDAVIRIFSQLKARIFLAAPTGRAAKRMTEATGYPAKTIHRMLEYSIQKGGFQRNQDKPIEADVLIIDEVSMIDTILMYHLLKALPEYTTLIMVGDINQLPSVGAGNVLRDIIMSGKFPVVELTEIFRQAGKSGIIVNAHKINKGLIPELAHPDADVDEFFFIEQDDPEKVVNIIKKLVCERIPEKFGFDPVNEIQVMSPMHKGAVGTGNLNNVLQEALNTSRISIARGERLLKLNDKVMQIKNNYDKEVFNGDIGRISLIDPDNQKIMIDFEGFPIEYDYSELDEILLAYAISVHKSQGSEYPAVVFPILSQHYMLLQRNLIYTAVTRGKGLVVIVGSKKALSIGIRNDKIKMRYTFLKERIGEMG